MKSFFRKVSMLEVASKKLELARLFEPDSCMFSVNGQLACDNSIAFKSHSPHGTRALISFFKKEGYDMLGPGFSMFQTGPHHTGLEWEINNSRKDTIWVKVEELG